MDGRTRASVATFARAAGEDFDMVGSEDYTIWRDTLGSTTDLRADGNDNLVVDQADWDVWKSHFNRTLTLNNFA